MFLKKLPSILRNWGKLGPAIRKMRPLFRSPHCTLFCLSLGLALLVGWLFIWSMRTIVSEVDLMLCFIPILCAVFSWYAIVKEPIILVALYNKSIWQLLKRRIAPYHIARLDPNEGVMRERLATLIQAGYSVGVTLVLLSIF